MHANKNSKEGEINGAAGERSTQAKESLSTNKQSAYLDDHSTVFIGGGACGSGVVVLGCGSGVVVGG